MPQLGTKPRVVDCIGIAYFKFLRTGSALRP